MWVCKRADFYKGICPALDVYTCNSKLPCGNKITFTEYKEGQDKVAEAKALLEKCGYRVIKECFSKR